MVTPPPVVKNYSLFQRSVRVVQTSVRRLNWWMLQRMPGLPNPPEMEEQLRKPTFVDLWEFTLADHRRNVKDAWREYVASFQDPSDLDLEKSKQEIKDAARRLRGQVEDNTSKNMDFIGEKLEGTQVMANLQELRSTGEKNVDFIKQELAHAKDTIDTEAVIENVRATVDEHRSKDDVVTTLSKNVDEIVDLVKTGRDVALSMEKQDVEAAKANAQSWFADKLMVGQSVLLAFIAGYKEGKELELTREDALLITFAKQAAEDQKEMLQQQFEKLMAEQRERQRKEAEAKMAHEATQAAQSQPVEEETAAAPAAPAAPPTSAHALEPSSLAVYAARFKSLDTSKSEEASRKATEAATPDALVQKSGEYAAAAASEKVQFSDDEDDDAFQCAAVDDAALGMEEEEEEEEEEDFAAVLRNLSKASAAGTGGGGGSGGASSAVSDKSSPEKPEAGGSSPKLSSLPSTLPRTHTQVRPSVVDDFIRNFLIKVGMTKTLDMFNHEWYEFISKGKLREDNISVVPDIYLRNQALDDQVKELRKQLDETRKITEKAKGTWDKFCHQRDVHKMHHQRVLQEKEALAAKIKKLEKHVASYEPLLQELKTKHENSMKEKMLMRLERDRQVAKTEALEVQLTAAGSSCGGGAPAAHSTKPKESSGALGSSGSSSKGSSSSKKSEGESKIPTHDGANPFLEKRFEAVNIERMELAKTCQGHGNSIAPIAFHPKNPIVATVSDDETWKLWSVPNCELIMSGEGHRSWLAGIVFHPKGTHVATSSGDNTVKIWDFVSALCSLTLTDHSHPVWESVFHHEGDFLASASMDHTCKLWDLATGKCRKTFRGHIDSVNSVCFQLFTGNLCTGSGDKTISIWDMRSGLCVQTFYGHQNACNSVAFSLAGDTIASCDADGFVKVWDVRMVAERATLDGGQHPLNSVAFDRSGKVLASASDDGSIKLFSLKADAFVAELKSHEGPVQSVKFEPNGRFLASSSSDCTFRLWST